MRVFLCLLMFIVCSCARNNHRPVSQVMSDLLKHAQQMAEKELGVVDGTGELKRYQLLQELEMRPDYHFVAVVKSGITQNNYNEIIPTLLPDNTSWNFFWAEGREGTLSAVLSRQEIFTLVAYGIENGFRPEVHFATIEDVLGHAIEHDEQ